MKTIQKLFIVLFVLSLCACATDEFSNLEDAQTALNNEDYDAAIESATAALTEDSTNALAARILANAYFGRSGIRYLDIAAGVFDLQDSDEANFRQIADVLPDPNTTTVSMDDVRSAIATLEAFVGIDAESFTDDNLADAAFDLGLMEVIEHFALGTYGAGYYDTSDHAVTADTVLGILDADAANAQTDLLNFDNRLISSGVGSDEEFIQEIRQAYCILEPLSDDPGFTTGEFQDFVGCELAVDSEAFVTQAVADCSVVSPDNQTDVVQACYLVDTSL